MQQYMVPKFLELFCKIPKIFNLTSDIKNNISKALFKNKRMKICKSKKYLQMKNNLTFLNL